ncbi:MAG: phosphate signaling complex protein PhoU [Clostridia bacterium]
MRGKFEEQLSKLNIELIKMGALCEHCIALASKSIFDFNDSLVSDVIKIEKDIDEKEKNIETLCFYLILTQQPVATDLRFISSALKLISDLERIGDQANDIAELSKFIKGTQLENETYLRKMSTAVINMVTQSIEAYVHRDEDLARQVIEMDDEVDDLFVKMRQEITDCILLNASNSETYIDYLLICKYYERIGDHAVNVAEWVIYSITGKHKGE